MAIITNNVIHAQMKICGLVSLRMEIISWKSRTVKVSLQTENTAESVKKFAAYLERLQIPSVNNYKFITTIFVIIFWDFLMFCWIFLSSQVKRTVIISNKHGIYELPHKLANDLRKLGNIEKISKLIEF